MESDDALFTQVYATSQPGYVLSSTSDDFALIHALLPAAPSGSTRNAADDGDDDAAPAPESLRSYILALMAVLYAQALSQVESIGQERSLLESVPADVDERRVDDRRAREREEAESGDRSWKLDRVNRGGPDGKGPLMDPSGKVRGEPASVLSSDAGN